MRSVSRFEANLLRILQGILRRAPREQIMPLVLDRLEAPPCLSRAVVELVEDFLAKGCVLILARHGWRHERFLHAGQVRAGQVRAGRLWQRTSPEQLGLAFSPHSLDFLRWLTSAGPSGDGWQPPLHELTVGDRLLFFFAYQFLRGSDAGKDLARQKYYTRDGLCRLVFPEDVPKAKYDPDWAPWTIGPGSFILEAWQVPLTERWLEAERHKGTLSNPEKMRALGDNQTVLLQGFTAAIDKAGRWDLAQFLLRACAEILPPGATAQHWIGKLNVKELRLADRVQTYRAALALLTHLEALQAWERQARTIGYFEDGYAASQLWKSLWETYQGDELCARASGILREVEPLKK